MFGGTAGLFGQAPGQAGLPTVSIPASVMSLAPPLPPALASAKRAEDREASGRPPPSPPAEPAWKLRLKQANESIVAPAKPIAQPAGHASIVPRKSQVKTLVVEPVRAAEPVAEAEKSEEPSPRPRHGDFFTTPSETILRRYTPAQLAAVAGFTAGQRGVGSVRFLQPVDLTEVPLDRLFPDYICFEPLQVAVYPDLSKKKPPGHGINVPAEVKLERCWPVNRATRQPITDAQSERHREHVDRLRRLEGTKFVDFANETGTWTFQVDHFSSYGVPSDIRNVDCDAGDSAVCMMG